jgi:hypothetical protein
MLETEKRIVVDARSFLRFTTDELHEKLEGDFSIRFADGELDVSDRTTIYSSYIWDFFRRYPDTPIQKKHHVADLMGGKELSSNAHLKLIERVLFSVYDAYEGRFVDKKELLNDLAKLTYEVTNQLYNELTLRCEEYVTSLDITDFVAITTHPQIDEASANMPPTEEGIKGQYELIAEHIYKNPMFKDNPLAFACRIGVARMNQVLQCVGPRGFLTDMDSRVFTAAPVTTGYVQGIRKMWDSMVESRSATKSLMNAVKPLQDSEYFSRRQQLICMNVKHLQPGDCGSQCYLRWPVRGKRRMGPKNQVESDLKTLEGKVYLDETTQTLKKIKISDTHLENTTILIRSPVAGCAHPDPYGICETCYGEGSLSIPANSNLGHIACVNMTAIIGQNILSTKHFEGSAGVEGIVLTSAMQLKYLRTLINGNRYYLNEKLKGKKFWIVIPAHLAPGLPDIDLVDNVDMLNLTRISEFDSFNLVIDLGEGALDRIPLDVHVKSRLSNMTYDLLRHVKKTGYSLNTLPDASQNTPEYVIDMSGWDFDKPIFSLPMSQYNTSDHQGEIAKILEATAEDIEMRSEKIDPNNMLIQLHDLVNQRLSVNLASLEVILYSSMVVSAVENNYDLPRAKDQKGIGVMKMLMKNRSLSAQLGFQDHHNTLIDPQSFIQKRRMNHLLDGVMMPELFNGPYRGRLDT